MNTPDIRSTETPALMRSPRAQPRQLMAASTGLAAASMVGPLGSPAAAAGNGVLIPRASSASSSTGARRDQPRPLTTDLPSGFKEVFAELARIGYKQIEFAGYTRTPTPRGRDRRPPRCSVMAGRQRPRGRGQPRQHPRHAITDATLASFDAACEAANILGMGHIGTGNDPTSSAYLADWQLAAERWNILGERAMNKHGLKLYTHNHSPAYSFLLDSGPLDALVARPGRRASVGSSGSSTTPTRATSSWRWTSSGRTSRSTSTTPTPPPTARPCRTSSTRWAPSTPTADALPAVPRQGRRLPAGYLQGYAIVPFGAGDIDYVKFLGGVGAKGYHNPMWEQDNAPSGRHATRGSRCSSPSTASTTWPSCAADLRVACRAPVRPGRGTCVRE